MYCTCVDIEYSFTVLLLFLQYKIRAHLAPASKAYVRLYQEIVHVIHAAVMRASRDPTVKIVSIESEAIACFVARIAPTSAEINTN